MIGSRGGDRLTISVIGRMHPQATDFYDGNWLLSPVKIDVGSFSARIPAGLRVDELREFRQELSKAYEDFGGIAHLRSMEEWLNLAVTVHPSGRVEIHGEAVDSPGVGNRLVFCIDDIDQSYLPAIIDSLASMEHEFPVRGEQERRRRARRPATP
jgi:hypothetical protein